MTINQLAASGLAFSGFAGGPLSSGSSAVTTIQPVFPDQCNQPIDIPYSVTATSGVVCQPAVLHVTFALAGASTCACS